MKLFNWQVGRQGTGYRKLKLAQGKCWDLWIIDYPSGTHIPVHTDPVPNKKHWRANLCILGEDCFEGDYTFKIGPLVIFRPDIMPHSVKITTRRRIVISFGIAL